MQHVRLRIETLERKKERAKERLSACAQYPELAHIYVILNDIGPRDHLHSEDEREMRGQEFAFRIITEEWRSPHVRDFLRLLDLLYLAARSGGSGILVSDGNDGLSELCLPYERFDKPGSTPIEGRPCFGLPVNFYDKKWLERQDEKVLNLMDIQEAVDLSFPRRLIKYAARALGILRTNCDGRIGWRSLHIGEEEIAQLRLYLRTGQRPAAQYGAFISRNNAD